MNIIEKYKAWRHKREWNADLQLYYLRIQVQEDLRWLASDPVATALCERYLSMITDGWEKRNRPSISEFRHSLKLDPHSPNYSPRA